MIEITSTLFKLGLGELVNLIRRLLVENGASKRALIQKAIDDTATAFPEIEGLHETLLTWCESPGGYDILDALEYGRSAGPSDHDADSLLEHTTFYAGDESATRAGQILQVFGTKLRIHLYTSSSGLAYVGLRSEILHEQGKEHTNQAVARIEETFQRTFETTKQMLLQPRDAISPDEVEDRVRHERVDVARDLIRQGRVRMAHSLLVELRSKIADDPASDKLLFRLASNLAACAVQLDDPITAQKELWTALRYQPKHPVALANAAAASLMSGDTERAMQLAEDARQLDASNSHAASIYIGALSRLGRHQQLSKLLADEPWMQHDAACCLVMGQSAYDACDFEQSEEYLRTALKCDTDDPHAHVLLAQVLVTPILDAIRADPPLPWRLGEETVKRLREGEGLLSRALDLLDSHDNRSWSHTVLINRAMVRSALDRSDEALADCNRVLGEDENHERALWHKGLVLIRAGRAPEAVFYLQRALELGPDGSLGVPLAYAHLELGQPEEAIRVLAPNWQPSSEDLRQIQLGEFLLRAYADSCQPEMATSVENTMRELWPNEPDALAAIAVHTDRRGDSESAIKLLRYALTCSTGHSRARIALQLAEHLRINMQWSEAAEAYESVVSPDCDSIVLRKYLTCLYNAGRFDAALSLATEMRRGGPAVPIVSEVEVLILKRTGDLSNARKLLEELVAEEPNITKHKISLVDVCWKQRDLESAQEVLRSVDTQTIYDDPQALLEVARARTLLGEGEALPLAYRARAIDFRNPDTHLEYCNVFHRRQTSEDDQLTPSEVAVDTVVRLRRRENISTYIISGVDSTNPDRDEISPNSALGQKLLGNKVGDMVVIRSNELEDLDYEVVGIQSKYVYAYQQTLSSFTTWFPESQAMRQIDVADNDFSRFFAMLDARNALWNLVRQFYVQHRAPLGAVANCYGISVIELWFGLTSGGEDRLLASLGTKGEWAVETESLSKCTCLVLDIIALSTLSYLELFDRISQGFDEIIVTQASVDEINAIFERLQTEHEPVGTVGKEGDHYVFQEYSKEAADSKVRLVQRIVDFINASATVVPTPSAAGLGRESWDKLSEHFGASGLTSSLAASERQALLYTDDFGCRMEALRLWQVNTVWTQPILRNLRCRELLSKDEYFEAVRKLAVANYHFIVVDADLLTWVLRRHDFEANDEVVRCIGLLRGPECTPESAVSVAVKLLRHVWQSRILDHRKLRILDVLLDALTAGPARVSVLTVLKQRLGREFEVNPVALHSILKNTAAWEAAHPFRGGLVLRREETGSLGSMGVRPAIGDRRR